MIFQISLLVLLLFLSCFFSGSETSLFALSAIEIKSLQTKKTRTSQLVARLTKDPRRLLMVILAGNMFVNICSSSLSETLFVSYFGEKGLVISVFVMTLLILIFGEITPKTLALQNPKKISLIVAPGVLFFQKIFSPLVCFFIFIADGVLKVFNIEKKKKPNWHIDEIKTAIIEGKKDGILHEYEANMLEGLLSLKEKTIEKIMKPRNMIFGLESKTCIKDAICLLKEKKFSRVPLYSGDLDHIDGLLYIKDLLAITYKADACVKDLSVLRKPIFVPENTHAYVLFRLFNQSRMHIAIVLDEYGGVAGLVTYEDLLEEIIGEVLDKDERIPEYRKIGEMMYEITAQMELKQFNALFKTNLSETHSITIAGFLTAKIGRIPVSGELFSYKHILFKITESQNNKILSLMVTLRKKRKSKEL
ncbi:hemolysin family protein [Chlamydiota bacterium]